jgi:hypothetical protein
MSGRPAFEPTARQEPAKHQPHRQPGAARPHQSRGTALRRCHRRPRHSGHLHRPTHVQISRSSHPLAAAAESVNWAPHKPGANGCPVSRAVVPVAFRDRWGDWGVSPVIRWLLLSRMIERGPMWIGHKHRGLHDERSSSFRLTEAEPASFPWGRWAR